MPNLGSVLREEILRLARKEGRSQLGATRKATAQHRRDIAALKRQVIALQHQVNSLLKRASRDDAAPAPRGASEGTRLRFVAKGLKSHRARLGLSAGEFGKLVGASGQSVYMWETGKTVPRREQVARLAAVRALGKREAMKRLEGSAAATQRPAKRPKAKGRDGGNRRRRPK